MDYRLCCSSCRGVFYARQNMKNVCPYCGLVVLVKGCQEVNLGSGISPDCQSKESEGEATVPVVPTGERRGHRQDKRVATAPSDCGR